MAYEILSPDSVQAPSKPSSGAKGKYEILSPDSIENEGARWGMQVVKNLPYAIPGVGEADMASNLLAYQYAASEPMNELKDLLESGKEVSPEKLQDLSKRILDTKIDPNWPTLGNLYQKGEEAGVPLEAKTKGQKRLSLATAGGLHAGGGVVSKAVTGLGTVGLSESMQEHLGMPEWMADLVAMFGAGKASQKFASGQQGMRSIQEQVRPPESGMQPMAPQTPSEPPSAPPGATSMLPQTSPMQPVSVSPRQTPRTFSPTALNAPNVTQQLTRTVPTESRQPIEQQFPQLKKPIVGHDVGQEFQNALTYPEPPQAPQETVEPYTPSPQVLADPHKEPLAFEKHLGEIISPREHPSTTEGGKELVYTIGRDFHRAHQQDTENYRLSREAMQGIVRPPFPAQQSTLDTANWLNAQIQQYTNRPIDTLSTIERRYLRKLGGVARLFGNVQQPHRTRNVANAHQIIGGSEHNPLPDTLVRTIQSLNAERDFLAREGHQTNIINPLIARLNPAVTDAVEGNHEAMRLWNEARAFHAREIEEMFNNPSILPYRGRKAGLNLAKLYEKATKDIDSLRALQKVLSNRFTEHGQEVFQATKRSFVNNKLSKYVKNPKKIGDTDFRKDMQELTEILTPEEMENVNQAFTERTQRLSKEGLSAAYSKEFSELDKNLARKQRAAQSHSHKIAVAKYESEHGLAHSLKRSSPEGIFKFAHTLSGRKAIEDLAKKYGISDGLVKRFKEAVFVDIATNGKHEVDPKTILAAINDVDKRAVMEKCVGKSTINSMEKYAKSLQKMQDLLNFRKKGAKTIDIKEDASWLKELKKPKGIKKALMRLQAITSGKRAAEAGIDALLDVYESEGGFLHEAKIVDQVSKELMKGSNFNASA